jgi:hypothetical protein
MRPKRSQSELEVDSSDEGRFLLLIWLLIASSLGIALIAATLDQRPLDDPDLVFQRPGFLDAHGSPFPAPALKGVKQGQKTVVFFVRHPQLEPLRLALERAPYLLRDAQIRIVVPTELLKKKGSEGQQIPDPTGMLARGLRMPRPRDGGLPVGYAIADRAGQVRYRTLDPGMADRLKEVRTILRATP